MSELSEEMPVEECEAKCEHDGPSVKGELAKGD